MKLIRKSMHGTFFLRLSVHAPFKRGSLFIATSRQILRRTAKTSGREYIWLLLLLSLAFLLYFFCGLVWWTENNQKRKGMYIYLCKKWKCFLKSDMTSVPPCVISCKTGALKRVSYPPPGTLVMPGENDTGVKVMYWGWFHQREKGDRPQQNSIRNGWAVLCHFHVSAEYTCITFAKGKEQLRRFLSLFTNYDSDKKMQNCRSCSTRFSSVSFAAR